MAFARQKTDARGRVNMRDLTTRAVGLRTFAIGRARLTIAYDPPKSGAVDVEGFANQLLQAVLNLIVNAEQALAGQQGGTIRVELELPEGWVVVRVSDNGPGVDPAMADRLFEPFMTTRSRDESSGLGLAVARHIAEQHGGTLTLEAAGTGACFALRLPAAPRSTPTPNCSKLSLNPHSCVELRVGSLELSRYAAPRSRFSRCSLSMNVVRLKLSSRAA